MDNQLKNLYRKIREGKISTDEAAKQMKLLKSRGNLHDDLQAALLQNVSELLSVDVQNIDVNAGFDELGFDHVTLTRFINQLNQQYQLELNTAIFLQHPTIQSFADYLMNEYPNVFAKRSQSAAHHPLSAKKEMGKLQPIKQNVLQEKAIQYFKKLLSEVIKLPASRIEADAPLEIYGIDSVMVMQLTNKLEETFGPLSKTLFFEYKSIEELTGYFLEAYRDQLIELLGIEERTESSPSIPKDSAAGEVRTKSAPVSRNRSRFTSFGRKKGSSKEKEALDIAIVGVSGRYPKARNIREFWKNLREGKDCITEIPEDRWDHSLYYDENRNIPGKTYGKWGGFLDGVDEFDALFFNTSPREAMIMDPQERLFLECVYETLEDAGYTRHTLGSQQGRGLGGNVGVFVGVMYEEYQLFGSPETMQGSGHPAGIPNRVSYFCNFHGPSVAVDTMCSSSLTAIHLACQSIRQGECDAAIAGGVNLSIHPNKYLLLAQGNFLSSKGRCESFGEGGDGYVPGEGVGAILLKPLEKAIADGDQIYGIIKGTALNHGGKTNGFFVPNPNAQASVILQAFKKAGIDPRAISYIEAHGTGTALGDPIEITSLKKAFQEFTNEKQFCAIGSVKSNIGHCESAAGIAAVTKVLLQMKHRQLVPSLHSDKLNPNIDFEDTPFFVQQKLTEWKRPLVQRNGEIREYPRIAGISSFGAGGSNAHVVIEEYVPEEEAQHGSSTFPMPAIIVLSAKTEKQLQEQVRRLLTAIEEERFTDSHLANIAYTLQVGREAMDERLAIIVESIQELQEKMKGFLEGQEGIEGLYRGQVKRNKETVAIFTADEELWEAVGKWIERGKFTKLADLWVKGLPLDWNLLYGQDKPRRISLPTYPFARERYWVPIVESKPVDTSQQATPATLHPLLHQNTSDFLEYRFSSSFTGQETFLTEYGRRGQKGLPHLASLEMVRAAVNLAAGSLQQGEAMIQLKKVVWADPILVEEQPVLVNIGLISEENGDIAYEIYSKCAASQEVIVHSQGVAAFVPITPSPSLDVISLQAQFGKRTLSSGQLYEFFRAAGVDYAPEYQTVEKVYEGPDQVLARIKLPPSNFGSPLSFVLHPGILESALQVSSVLIEEGSKEALPLLQPIAMEKMDIMVTDRPLVWTRIRFSDSRKTVNHVIKLDMEWYDEQGNVCVSMKGLEVRPMKREMGRQDHSVKRSIRFVNKQWEPCAATPTKKSNRTIAILMTAETKGLAHQLSEHFARCEFWDLDQLESQLRSKRDWKNYDGLIDLVGCGERQYESLVWIEWLQQLIEQGHKEKMTLLCVTRGLESFKNDAIRLSGADRVGLYRMLQSEYSHLRSRHMDVENLIDDRTLAEQIASEFLVDCEDPEICYRHGERFRSYLAEVEDVNVRERVLRFPEDHVVWITGGTRGIGLVCAQHMIRHYGVKRLVLTGREELPPREVWDSLLQEESTTAKKIKEIRSLEAQGVQVQVLSVPLSDEFTLHQSVQEIKRSMGPIGGVIHCAGISDFKNPAFIRKSLHGIQEVLSPKVVGLNTLFNIFKNEPLQFFILFSSVSAIIPSLASGQSDYAMANAYMDYFAEANCHACPIVSIQWPSWKETGMGEAKSKAYQQTGLLSITNAEGMQLLDYVLANRTAPVILPAVVNPDIWVPRKLSQRTLKDMSSADMQKRNFWELKRERTETADSLTELTQTWLKGMFAQELRMDPSRLDPDTEFQEYGFDSIMLAQIVSRIERECKGIDLEPSALIEHPTLESFTRYLTQTYSEAVSSLFAIPESEKESTSEINTYEPAKLPRLQRRQKATLRETKVSMKREKIAIIGMACHFPGAMTLSQYWENLISGKDCITEVPKSRWDWEKFYHPKEYKDGKTISKWGGFLEGIEEFDPAFFKIPEAQAPQIDPLQRQWLEVSAEALADAGFGREDVWGKQIGVFVGTRAGGFAQKVKGRGNDWIAGTAQNFIAAHFAHIYNLKGPNMVVDTACSSSLTAIHLAVRSIQNGESELALAGGVDILLDESPFLGLSAAKVLSPDGRCKTFDAEANGIVLGEGCGVLVLKPLKKAIQDQDKIYGVIDGSALNNDGNTMGVTTPNPKAQQELIEKAIADANINPETISYIETHGTGTLIGDPIELKALTQTFAAYTSKKQFCGVGSVKSNLGHLLSAAGAASIIKVLLAIIHGEIPPTLHCHTPNPRFQFEDSPFYPVQQAKKWTSETNILRAGISAFGLGGNNAHIIVSNEGVPDTLKATLEPKGKPVIFHRKRFWPEPTKGQAIAAEHGDDPFMEFFELTKL
ncbi:type I polyketide synthase [Thermoflavimicrobium dichotomicum]|uniref:Polyketide synthase PksN n=1 Tax=Thermoflavimicrobium dichotomicum TaxID=46223 RepID=A0A1I3V509_9BACL|nr:type I polyketide synthase [Thermoflavimicrobium dichotomicum]SFJ89257.1 polyketide synthase PksN [Thermoflavimicrobium dichotomicum]